MKRTISMPVNIPQSTPKYWRDIAFTETLAAQQESAYALKREDVSSSFVGDEVQVIGTGQTAIFYVTGVYKPGFDYNGGKVKSGFCIITLRAQHATTIGHAGFAVQGLTGSPFTSFANPKDAVLQVPKQVVKDLPENLYASANFLERALPVAIGAAILFFAWKLLSKFIK